MPSIRQDSSRPTLAALTGLRFVAALSVVLYHVPLPPGTPSAVVRLLSRGYLGVSLFFVLSGFILTYTYVDPVTGTRRGSARDFWWARVARVYPTYIAALLLSLPIFAIFRVGLAAPSERAGTLLSAALTPLLLQAWWPSAATQWNTPGWSLSVEVFFYALFPVGAAWLASRRHPGRIAIVAWAACLVPSLAYLAAVRWGAGSPPRFDHYFWLQAVKFNPVAHLGEFALGAAAGLEFLRRGRASFVSRPAFAWAVPIGAVGVAVVVVATDWLPYALCHGGLLAPVWTVIILRLAAGRGAGATLLGTRPLVRLGEVSYALYLVHSPLLGYQRLAGRFVRIRYPDADVPTWLATGTFLAVALGLSFILFHRVEEPARRAIRARRLTRRPSSTAAADRRRNRGVLASGSTAIVHVPGTP